MARAAGVLALLCLGFLAPLSAAERVPLPPARPAVSQPPQPPAPAAFVPPVLTAPPAVAAPASLSPPPAVSAPPAVRPPAAALEPVPVATDARLAGDDNRTRFVIDVSRPLDLTAFTLADPYRVVIDLPQVVFNLPAKTGEGGRGLVKAFRFGLVMQGGSRIVMDLTRPVKIEKSFVLPAADGQPARLVIELAAVDRDTFLRTLALEKRPGRQDEGPRKGDREAAARTGDARPLIVLDPGHGGVDNGTHAASGESEKTMVLEFALLLRDKLMKSGKYRIVMTRDDDRFIPLADRVRVARAQKAALFISIHADALARGEGDASGATVYTLSDTATDSEAARLADAENKADAIGGVDLSGEPDDVIDILLDLAQRETRAFSQFFARTLVASLKNAAKMHKHPLKSAGFRVLKAPDIPSVLVELGYVTSKQDLKFLTSDAWRAKATDSIQQAIDTYFTTRLAGTGPIAGAN